MNSKIVQQVMGTFLREMEGHVQTMTRDILALEREESVAPREDRVSALLRAAHGLKGAARVMGQPLIVASCHEMESLLTSGQYSARAPIEPLLAALDALKEAGARLRAERDRDAPPSAEIAPQPTSEPAAAPSPFQSPTRGGTAPRDPAAPDPSSTDPRRSVRVSAAKLDLLLARSEELLVARRGADQREADIAAIRAFVRAWETDWRAIDAEIRELLRDDSGPAISRRAARVIEAARDNFGRLQRDLARVGELLGEDRRRLDSVAAPLDDEVRRIRMTPFAEACEGLDRAVHDLGKSSGKDVELILEGGEVELDRAAIDALRDPLLHLVRNAMDHGIEAPADREAAGKHPRARVAVRARLRGAQVEVVVSDDGRGLDIEAIREEARHMGLPEPEDEHALARLVLYPRFSTARAVTDVSGRGVGLDVVKTTAERLRGSVDLSFIPGEGARFVMTVPLTSSAARMLLDRGQEARRPRLLVVDDVLSVRSAQKSALEAAGFDVTLAADGAKAWALLQQQTFDLVVSDVEMPGMDGFALTEAIRGSSRTLDLPVVLVTSRGSEAYRARGALAGANAYLVKSAFDEDLLLTTIRRLL